MAIVEKPRCEERQERQGETEGTDEAGGAEDAVDRLEILEQGRDGDENPEVMEDECGQQAASAAGGEGPKGNARAGARLRR